jgi:hypothetical protein
VSYMRRSTCTHLLATLFLRAMSVVSAVLSMVSNKPLVLGLNTSPRLSLLLDLLLVSMILLFSFILPPVVVPLFFYVDDMLITGDDSDYIAFVKARLSEQFHMSHLGPLSYFLGIKVTSTHDSYYLSQGKYIHDLLDRAGLTDHRFVDTPMELHTRLRGADGVPLEDPTCYRHLVDNLVYLGITRPDISYDVQILSQFMSTQTSVHYSHLLRVL